jgi:hypothetical protein
MTVFDERERAFEKAFSHDEEVKFKIQARRDKFFGAWIAEKLGLQGSDADECAVSYVLESLKIPGDTDITDKAIADLATKGLTATEAELNLQLAVCLRDAKEQYKVDMTPKG